MHYNQILHYDHRGYRLVPRPGNFIHVISYIVNKLSKVTHSRALSSQHSPIQAWNG